MPNRGRHKIKADRMHIHEISNITGVSKGVLKIMMQYQEKQGNKPNLLVFCKDAYASQYQGGFNWDDTPEGYEFWHNVARKIYVYELKLIKKFNIL
jgi:hypothetical protein